MTPLTDTVAGPEVVTSVGVIELMSMRANVAVSSLVRGPCPPDLSPSEVSTSGMSEVSPGVRGVGVLGVLWVVVLRLVVLWVLLVDSGAPEPGVADPDGSAWTGGVARTTSSSVRRVPSSHGRPVRARG